MENYIVLALAWIIFAGYLAWRFHSGIKRKMPLDKEITWAVYFAAATVLGLLGLLVPRWTKGGMVSAAVAWFVVSFVVSFSLNRRYHRWLEQKWREEETNG